MKKLCAVLITVFLLSMSFSCYAEIADLRWGMTKEEALTASGLKGKAIDGPGPNESLLSFTKVPISMFSASVDLIFLDDQLVMKMYSISEEKLTAFRYLTKALEAKYGEVSFDDDTALFMLNLADMYMIKEDLLERKESKELLYRTWKTSDNTLVCLVHLDSGLTSLMYSPTQDQIPKKILNTDGL